jgi:tetratricopeptide (TPR) repeat protein
MFKAHAFFGVGVDRYAAYFLQYRAPKYPLIYGYTQTVTNSHNVFLEILATAGIFAGIAYIALILFVAYRAYVAIRNSSGREQMMIAGIVAGWIVFVAQSVISVDSLVISIWGWVLGGAIVALSLKDLQPTNSISVGRRPKSIISRKGKSPGTASPYRGIVFAGSLIALCLIVVSMYRNETATARFSLIQSPTDPAGKDVYRAIAKKTFYQPLLNPNYKVNIALTMAKNGYGPEAITYFKETIKADPRNTNSYSLLALVYEDLKNPKEAIVYRKQLAVLDPYGAENLVSLQKDYLLTGDKSSAIAIRDSILAMAPGTDVAKRAAGLITK